ncbi:Glycosyl transferase family 2 [Xylanibacter ruminicola]|uniref:glycosyltransferase family 2 protein n=1 Tax=Xylanibacter ruminicola TaxID=839 RepID=UPI0008E526B4|nr:glycosyltransferase family A protein [Xylanibacter ruminicola]SFC12200.1 Glycosyl transferase family 2 [Xylanibacter ruminicola]
MANWYDKYLSIYGKTMEEVPNSVLDEIKANLAQKQSQEPLVSVVVIAYNEERRLAACLWSLSELQTKYPIEILGVNNNSKDGTEEVYQRLGLPYFNELKQSPGFARQCGLEHAKGKYHFCIDADTFYPARYVDLMMSKLVRPDVACVSSFWSFFPDENHSRFGLFLFELIRDMFLFVQHFKRPELCVRGMVFAFNAEYARQVKIRTDIRRGEDGSLALSLKTFGKIAFLYHCQARPVTGYGTIGSQSLWQSFVQHVKIQGKGLSRIFYKKDHYEDSEDNLVKRG